MASLVRKCAPCFVLVSVLYTLTYGQYVVDPLSMQQWAYDLVDQNTTDGVEASIIASSAVFESAELTTPSDKNVQGMSASDSLDVKPLSYLENDMVKLKSTRDDQNADPVRADFVIPNEANEPLVTQKKFTCLGCATEVDLDISPENREAVKKLGETIAKSMDDVYVGPFIHANPNILRVQKQVEFGIRYIIRFESYLSSCLKTDNRRRDECPPQGDSRTCVAELLKKSGKSDEVVSNNCTDIVSPMDSIPNNIPVLKSTDEVLVNYDSLPSLQEKLVTEDFSQEPMSDLSEENFRMEQSFSLPEDNVEVLQEKYKPSEAERVRRKRWTNVGALKDVGRDEKDLIANFAQLAVRTLDEVDPDDTRRIVLRIVEAKKQIVNGVMYHLVLHVATSVCPEHDVSIKNSNENCLEDKQHPEKVCRVQILRSWAGESPQNAKVVKSECADLWLDDGAPSDSSVLGRSSRSNKGKESWTKAGGWEKYDLQNQTLSDCLHAAIDSLHDILLVDDVSKAATMMDAHTRVNQGTKAQELAVLVYLADPKKLKVTEDMDKPVLVSYQRNCHKRQQRSPGMPGGLSDADENSPRVKELLNFGLSEIEKSSNSPYRLSISRVIKVQTQVVAGTLLHVTLEISPTRCLKSDVSDSGNCSEVTSNEGKQICDLKIWDRPWLNERKVTKMECEPSSSSSDTRSKRETLLGAPFDIDVTNPYVKDMAEYALADIHKHVGANDLQSLKVVRILEAKKQIVSGTLTHLKLEVGPSSCQGDTKLQSELCSNTSNQESLICSLKVWDQPWTNTKQVQDLECRQSRVKRDVLVGAPESVDVNDDYVKELAEFAVLELDKKTNSRFQQRVIRITEAKKQLVSGILMHLKMELGVTSCLKGETKTDSCPLNSEEKLVCSLKVYDQSWTKTREVQDVQCGTVRSRRSYRSKRDVTPVFSGLKVNKEDPYIVESAWYAVAEMDKSVNSPFHRRVEEIMEATVEHAELTTVKMLLKVAASSCVKDPACTEISDSCKRPTHNSDDCPVQDGTTKYVCNVEISHRPWLKERHLKMSSCSNFLDGPSQGNNHLIGGDDHDLHAGMFREFLLRYNKTYSSDSELKARFRVFRENLKLIKELQGGEQGTAIYGPTMFADLTPKEFKQKYLGLRTDLHQENAIPIPLAKIPNIHLPEAFDWRDHNAVTPVKNQGACGSCWAFAVTGNLEGQYAIKHGKLLSLSEQELVDCDKLDSGCNGGLFETAYQSIEQLGGLETEADYPYEGINDQCQFNRSEVRVRLSSSVNITSNETAMAQWLVKNGPIAIAINANAMQFYMGGVSHPFKFLCSSSNLDHGVLIVGYGVHTTSIRHKVLPYWIIKNSWSTWWGEKGYYRVYRGDGTCGVNQMATSGIVT